MKPNKNKQYTGWSKIMEHGENTVFMQKYSDLALSPKVNNNQEGWSLDLVYDII